MFAPEAMTAPQPAAAANPYRGAKLSQSGSLLLDCIRFFAALAVLAHHFADSYLSVGWMSLGTLGYHAVCVFFVLSGFIIRFITVTRPGTAAHYAMDRASRIYSVVLPALVFTVICEAAARAVHPAVYQLMRDPFQWSHVPLQLLVNATFTAQCWGYGISPLSNDPFWSMSYEVLYYAIYGLLFFRVRGRFFWSLLILLVAGPNIAGLGLTWLLGALTADAYLWLHRRRKSLELAWGITCGLLLFLFAVRHPLLRAIHSVDHDVRVNWMTRTAIGWGVLPSWMTAQGVPWVAQLSPSFGVLAVITAALMLALLLTLDRFHPSLPPRATRWTRWLANSTFTLYLFHVPALMLVVVVIGHPIASKTAGAAIATLVVMGATLLSVYLDRLKDGMRSFLHRDPPGQARGAVREAAATARND